MHGAGVPCEGSRRRCCGVCAVPGISWLATLQACSVVTLTSCRSVPRQWSTILRDYLFF